MWFILVIHSPKYSTQTHTPPHYSTLIAHLYQDPKLRSASSFTIIILAVFFSARFNIHPIPKILWFQLSVEVLKIRPEISQLNKQSRRTF